MSLQGDELDNVQFGVVDIASPLAQRVIGEYFAELDRRFDGGFRPTRGGADDDAGKMSPPSGAFAVLTCAGRVIGCGGVQAVDAATAEVKRMWIAGSARGLGLGRRLLYELEAVAGDLGYQRVVLDTNGSLTEAISMYERSGYGRIERYNDNPYAHHWFAKQLAPRAVRPE
jgi:GNAT superfamily N-acetyltransferase